MRDPATGPHPDAWAAKKTRQSVRIARVITYLLVKTAETITPTLSLDEHPFLK